jgi:hypothetical protein
MYRKASEQQSFLKRVASHSTKPFATGRVDILPPGARPKEAIYQRAKAQWESAKESLARIEVEQREITERLKTTLPHKEFQQLEERRRSLGAIRVEMQNTLAEHRSIARAAGREAWGEAFRDMAWLMLPRDTCSEIEEAVRQCIGREEVEIEKPTSQRSPEAKHARTHKGNLKARREQARNARVNRADFSDS